MLTRRKHPRTGENAYQFIDWSPKDLTTREQHRTLGYPLRDIFVCADRVEIAIAWCFSSGMAEFYESGPTDTLKRHDPRVGTEVERFFGAALAAEIAQVFADPNAFVGLEKRREPDHGEEYYIHGATLRVYADRIELASPDALFAKASPGWPDAGITEVRRRHGDAIADEAARLLVSPGAFIAVAKNR